MRKHGFILLFVYAVLLFAAGCVLFPFYPAVGLGLAFACLPYCFCCLAWRWIGRDKSVSLAFVSLTIATFIVSLVYALDTEGSMPTWLVFLPLLPASVVSGRMLWQSVLFDGVRKISVTSKAFLLAFASVLFAAALSVMLLALLQFGSARLWFVAPAGLCGLFLVFSMLTNTDFGKQREQTALFNHKKFKQFLLSCLLPFNPFV